MTNRKTQNDSAWQSIFEKYRILDHISANGKYVISAKQIKEFREPRLMAKIDHRLNSPAIFIDNDLSILPITRGEYVISHFDCFKTIDPIGTEVIDVKFPPDIQSINPYNITSESVAINCALACGIFSRFLGEERLTPTVHGRMGSGKFGFSVRNAVSGSPIDIAVNNAQIEIDAAYEGVESLTLVEAKRDLSSDFVIRQLFYPFKTWEPRISKALRLVYLIFTNDIFNLYEYRVADPSRYNSLELAQSKRYSFEDTRLDVSDIENIVRGVRIVPEPLLPFPQANSFERVINLCELLYRDPLRKDEVTEEYDFDMRQTDYYVSAGRYLGLIAKERRRGGAEYRLTERGERILGMRYRERQMGFCECILEHMVFRNVFLEYLRSGSMPDTGVIAGMMREANCVRSYGETTFRRRASTVAAWLGWILKICE